jgi:hypothetical protein
LTTSEIGTIGSHQLTTDPKKLFIEEEQNSTITCDCDDQRRKGFHQG